MDGNLSFTVSKDDSPQSLHDWFNFWVNKPLESKNIVDITLRQLTKKYPYKSKKKRLVKKWWKKHSKLIMYKNCKLSLGKI